MHVFLPPAILVINMVYVLYRMEMKLKKARMCQYSDLEKMEDGNWFWIPEMKVLEN